MKRDLKAEAAATKKLLRFLGELFEVDDDYEPYIEPWGVGPWGFRLAEIGVVAKDRSGGATHFRCESGNALLFLRCEDLFTQWAYHVGPNSDIKEWKDELRKWASESGPRRLQ